MPTVQEQEFIERYALFFERAVGSRTGGRLHAWLQICDPPYQSLNQLTAVAGVSKASVSTVIRQLEQLSYVERAPVPGTREHYYQVRGGGDASRMIEDRTGILAAGREVAELGLAAVGDDPPRRERLEEMLDLYTFLEEELTTKLLHRWERYREERRDARRRARHGN